MEKPLTTKLHDIKMDFNYALRKHDDIMILISVSVCHYPLFFSLSSKTHHTSVLQLVLFHYLFSHFLDFKPVTMTTPQQQVNISIRSQDSHSRLQ